MRLKKRSKRNRLVIIDYISDIITSLQCIIIPEPSIEALESCNELITDFITLKNTEKTKKTLKLKIKKKLKELEQKKNNELKLLEEEMYFMTLRNKHLGRSSHIIKEEEIDLREQSKKKVGEIEKLKEEVDGIEFQSVKALEDLNF